MRGCGQREGRKGVGAPEMEEKEREGNADRDGGRLEPPPQTEKGIQP